MTIAADDLASLFPSIDWREPVTVSVVGRESRLCCRICVASFGLKAFEIDTVRYCFNDLTDFAEHMILQHPMSAEGDS